MHKDISLETFVLKINDLDSLPLSGKIDFFVYYFTEVKGEPGADASMIRSCFSELKITPYSNIPAYLKGNIKRGKGTKAKFILNKQLYHLERSYKTEIERQISMDPVVKPTDNYFPLSLFENTRGYLLMIAKQACACYDAGLYDACAVMTRKLVEVLIIEAFETHRTTSKITGTNGYYYYLSDLITELLAEKNCWNVGRNARTSIPNLKSMGDQSAHNRRYFVQSVEINKIKGDLRIVIEELLHIIDYPTLNAKKKS
ncbi:hypothetical protein [Chitinophaga sp. CF418]|uniref:hypothetical protein n=1 Tax=Chitinophaga sp. CF418 TaxID=1855287 RepID=UPI00091BC091|nr:hypothetical protein [Chitinophaga sp. CF418]SHN46082.1 hypothetical protein SAMN05216311_122110 [Chitinophaga sp. CF418]